MWRTGRRRRPNGSCTKTAEHPDRATRDQKPHTDGRCEPKHRRRAMSGSSWVTTKRAGPARCCSSGSAGYFREYVSRRLTMTHFVIVLVHSSRGRGRWNSGSTLRSVKVEVLLKSANRCSRAGGLRIPPREQPLSPRRTVHPSRELAHVLRHRRCGGVAVLACKGEQLRADSDAHRGRGNQRRDGDDPKNPTCHPRYATELASGHACSGAFGLNRVNA